MAFAKIRLSTSLPSHKRLIDEDRFSAHANVLSRHSGLTLHRRLKSLFYYVLRCRVPPGEPLASQTMVRLHCAKLTSLADLPHRLGGIHRNDIKITYSTKRENYADSSLASFATSLCGRVCQSITSYRRRCPYNRIEGIKKAAQRQPIGIMYFSN